MTCTRDERIICCRCGRTMELALPLCGPCQKIVWNEEAEDEMEREMGRQGV